MNHTYIDSLPTAEKSAHKAILERHDAIEEQLANLAAQFAQNASQMEDAAAYFASTRLARVLRFLRLI